MNYYYLPLLIFPLIVGGLELHVFIKNRRRALEKRRNTEQLKHFKETGRPSGVRKIKIVCQNESYLKELVSASFGLEWELIPSKRLSDDTYLFTLPNDIAYPRFCHKIQFIRGTSMIEEKSNQCSVTGWYSIGKAVLNKEEAPFSHSMLMITVPEWDEECYVYMITPDNACYRHEETDWGTLYRLFDVNLPYMPIPE